MAFMWRRIVDLVFLCSCLHYVWCYPTGAPTSACVEMLPGHRNNGQPVTEQSVTSSPYAITASSSDYHLEQSITVTIGSSGSSSLQFLGFLVQARAVATGLPVGKFIAPDNNGARVFTCSNTNDSITHNDTAVKTTNYFLEWIAPSTNVGDIEFFATVAYSKEIFWRKINSSVLTAFSNVCDPNPCFNGGTCYQSTNGRSYFCGCANVSNKNRNCEEPCSPNPCLNNGYCQESNGSFICYCPGNRYGTLCENVIIGCDTDPCGNGATCMDHSTGYLCNCTEGFTGPDCNTLSPCTNNPCINGGTCSLIGLSTGYSCTCVDGFSGTNCETVTNLCIGTECQNGGTCYRNQGGSTICVCTEGFTGVNCETVFVHPCILEVTPCNNGGVCFIGSSGGNSYICQCQDGYSGPHCDISDPCIGVLCSTKGTCVTSADQTGYTCACESAYNGDNCEYTNFCILNNQCQEGSTCIYTGQNDFYCTCRSGFGGTFCELDLSCNGNPCRNGGTCSRVGDGTHTCNCVPTYSGNNCETYTNPCQPNPCVNGDCSIDFQSPSGWKCSCYTNYMGKNCSMYNGNVCEVFPCNNGGTCVNDNQQATCVCPEEYSGLNCEIALNVPPVFSGCPSGSTLQYPMIEGSNVATISLTITATDKNSNTLQVVTMEDPSIIFPSTITFTEEYRNGKSFKLNATDGDGRSSLCVFTIRIYDDEDPVVVCPADISDITTQDLKEVQWLPATATDNLGLATENPIEYEPANGTNFMASANGEPSTVLVKAHDSFANTAECRFTVTVYKKEQDCEAIPPLDNGQFSCSTVGEQRLCTVGCKPNFGNAVGSNMYECIYGDTTADWNPRPNSNICVPLKPGNGVNKVVSVQFPIDSSKCNSADLTNSVTSSLTDTLTGLGVCDPIETPCELAVKCSEGSTGRRKRAPTELTADITITSPASDEDTTKDVQGKLDTAVDVVTAAASSGSLTVEVDGETINNDNSVDVSEDYMWDCNAGQISSPNGCLSCPPGTFHNAGTNQCEHCALNTYQNKAEQDSCMKCPEGTPGNQQPGAYREDQCGEKQATVSSPWTPTLIAIVAAAGGLIVLLVIILACVFIVKASRSPTKRDGSGKRDHDGPLSNFTHLNHAYKEDDDEEPEMQFHGGRSATSDTTYQNVDEDAMETGSTDHLVRIPSLSQYSDYYATLNARSAPVFDDEKVPDTPPPPPPVFPPQPPSAGGPPPPPPAPPVPGLNANNSNTSVAVKPNGTHMNGGSKAKFQV